MTTPVTAITAFLPMVEDQRVRRVDGLAVRIATATIQDVRPGLCDRSKT